MPKSYDTRRSTIALDQDSTLIAVIEMSQESWLVAGIVPGIERQPLEKLAPDADADAVIRLLERWREEGIKAGRRITRVAVAFAAGVRGRRRHPPSNASRPAPVHSARMRAMVAGSK